MKKWMMIFAVIAILITGGILIYRHFVTGQIVDGPGMENPAAPMLELLNAEWMSEDGAWSAHIEGDTLDLSYRQDLVYIGSFFFGFDGDDLNVKTELDFYDKQFESEDGSVSGTIECLYVENCRMYLDITTSKEGEGSIRQQAVLDRAEYGKPAESESEGIREVSEMAELVEFSWHQSAMNYDGCYDFSITPTGQDPAGPHLLCCRYADPETHETIEMGYDEYIVGFQGLGLGGTERKFDSEVCPPVPLERWEELADFLRNTELPAYRAPDPDLLDATNSNIQVTWRDGDEQFTNSYDGTSAHDLLELLQDIAGEAYRKAEEKP